MSVQPDLARRHDLLAARALLDDSLLGLGRVDVSGFPRQEAIDCVGKSLHHVYRALASRGDYAVFKAECDQALERARAALLTLQFREHQDEPVLDTMKHVAQAIGILSSSLTTTVDDDVRLPPANGSPPVPRASHGEPRPLRMSRAVLVPSLAFPVPASVSVEMPEVELPRDLPLPSPADLPRMAREAEALAASLDGSAADSLEPSADVEEREPVDPAPMPPNEIDDALFGRCYSVEEVLFERASDFLDELGAMSRIRRPGSGFDWNDLAGVEDRLLARVDAILACGDWVLPRLVARLMERPVADPELLWGLVLVFGCLEGDDAHDQVVRLVRAADLDDVDVMEALADALTHVPHARTEAQLRRWLGDPAPSMRVLGLRTLASRRALTADEVSRALRDDAPGVSLEAARAAVRTTGRLFGADTSWLLSHAEDPFVAAGFESGIVHGHPSAAWKAAQLTREGKGDHGRAVLYLALSGDESSLDVLREAAAAGGSAVLIDALGWFGHLEFIGYLIGRLRSGNTAAVSALQRITGATLTDDEPRPRYEERELPFTGERGWPIFEPELSVDADVWEAWWQEHRDRADPRVRYRHGHPFDLDDCLWEMEAAPVENSVRWLACLELMARTGSSLPFDPHLFAPSQRRQMANWRELVHSGRARFPTGGWHTRLGA